MLSFRLFSLPALIFGATVAASAQSLQAALDVDLTTPGLWKYSLRNLEPTGSGNWVSGFFLPIDAPISDVTAPPSWTMTTDGATYVQWQNEEPTPYAHDVAPGAVLGGFDFRSAGSATDADAFLYSYDHLLHDVGPNGFAPTLSPGPPVPEPLSLLALGVGLAGLGRRKQAA